MCDIEIEGYGVEFRDSLHTARKKRRCDECWRGIEPGETYSVYAGKFDGDFFTTRHCLRCTKARKWLGSRGHGWINGQILDHVKLCVESDKNLIIADLKRRRA